MMKRLTALQSLPLATPAGKILCRAGWDADTQTYLHLPFDYTPNIPEHPTTDQVQFALVQLMGPFRAYNWATHDDAAAAVCSVLTAVARPVLDLCPAVLFDASSQGSGKTKAATALGSLMTGRREGVLPFSGLDDDELRKQIISGVLTAQPFHCLDNVVGYFKSPTLAAVLTAGRLQGRVLGASRTVDASIRALFTLTSNNASLDADLLRRTMRVRIDSGVDPTRRRFDFCPVSEALRDRLKIAEAACVIWRACLNAGAPRIADDDAGGFESWSNLCRQPVLWLAREGLAEGLGWQLGDPAASMLADASGSDPELEAHADLLRALNALAPDGTVFSSQELLTWWKAGEHADEGPFASLREAVTECLNLRAGVLPTGRSIGRMLHFRRDRVVRNLQLLAKGDRSTNAQLWRVVHVG